jgi:hypothetical protein
VIFIQSYYFLCRLVPKKAVCVMNHFALVESMANILILHTSVSDLLNVLVALYELYMVALLVNYIMVKCVYLLTQCPAKLLRALLLLFKCQLLIPA